MNDNMRSLNMRWAEDLSLERAVPIDLLNDLSALVSRFVIVPEGAADMLALWVLHTYTFQCEEVSTYVGVESPGGSSTPRPCLEAPRVGPWWMPRGTWSD